MKPKTQYSFSYQLGVVPIKNAGNGFRDQVDKNDGPDARKEYGGGSHADGSMDIPVVGALIKVGKAPDSGH